MSIRSVILAVFMTTKVLSFLRRPFRTFPDSASVPQLHNFPLATPLNAAATASDQNLGVLFLNLGGPEKLEVRDFVTIAIWTNGFFK